MPHKEHWIQKAHIKSGGLHRTLGIPEGQKISEAQIERAKSMGGKAAKQAALAETFKGLGHKGNFRR
jgi:hypothetical protein